MDELDRALLDAWSRLGRRVRADRVEAAVRAARRSTPTLTRPPRAWCLCVRASDTRLDALAALASERDCKRGLPHALTLYTPAIRTLVAPVNIPWPGIRATRAAARLGRHPESLRNWLDKGLVHVRYDPPSIHSSRGKRVPVLWTPSPLDPNANIGRPPHAVWGTIWQYHHTRIPDTLTLTADRFPRTRADPRDAAGARPRHCGWLFQCPGRPIGARRGSPPTSDRANDAILPSPLGADARSTQRVETDEAPRCSRLVSRLYCPLPVTTLAHLLADDPLLPFPSPAPQSRPDAPCRIPDAFLCHHCHRIRYFTLDREGWNHFVTHISAGLLFGHEVPRPASLPHIRRRRYTPRTRLSPRRDQVERLLLQGLTYNQIADSLGLAYSTVHAHIKRLYKFYNVHSRRQLAALNELPSTHPSPRAGESGRVLEAG
ncbi:MAG: LuxR family transcriptional regulator [Leptolyngbya sp. PLA3]|nr:MAG: LuxR family transcriptional regulator [Cyanobacteria bacterium CYA]MCE7968460.1 LuxR family transcriptional regulator [Leptolyngbya sp. PL-A3]